MRIKIQIEQKHIDNGKRGHCRLCPVGLAISEQTIFFPNVGHGFISIRRYTDKGPEIWAYTPEFVRKFLIAFDESKPVEPFSVVLILEKIYHDSRW